MDLPPPTTCLKTFTENIKKMGSDRPALVPRPIPVPGPSAWTSNPRSIPVPGPTASTSTAPARNNQCYLDPWTSNPRSIPVPGPTASTSATPARNNQCYLDGEEQQRPTPPPVLITKNDLQFARSLTKRSRNFMLSGTKTPLDLSNIDPEDLEIDAEIQELLKEQEKLRGPYLGKPRDPLNEIQSDIRTRNHAKIVKTLVEELVARNKSQLRWSEQKEAARKLAAEQQKKLDKLLDEEAKERRLKKGDRYGWSDKLVAKQKGVVATAAVLERHRQWQIEKAAKVIAENSAIAEALGAEPAAGDVVIAEELKLQFQMMKEFEEAKKLRTEARDSEIRSCDYTTFTRTVNGDFHKTAIPPANVPGPIHDAAAHKSLAHGFRNPAELSKTDADDLAWGSLNRTEKKRQRNMLEHFQSKKVNEATVEPGHSSQPDAKSPPKPTEEEIRQQEDLKRQKEEEETRRQEEMTKLHEAALSAYSADWMAEDEEEEEEEDVVEEEDDEVVEENKDVETTNA
ncbi:hypothetical protein BJ508DRAFT_329073 [Ascobolus immersus RN42]|uniref:Uncharacterized protein n=1 Tax=Ascobolus immersus RN42 TaxID=1160509 RepID=A0A3N4HXN7_ASCIM|nr:hypothetical protein BJ508DRAFT_329073 [Ascobolus immersus RN42]